jgi:hypothetical protein
MGAFSTKGMKINLEKKPGSSPTPVTVISVSNAKPAVVTVGASDIARFKEGDPVTVAGTGITTLDGRAFVVGTLDDVANTFVLRSSDASSATAPATTGSVTNHMGDMVEFCLATLEYAQEPAQAISVGTTCDPAAQLAGEPQAGGVSISGFEDFTSHGFLEFLQAAGDGTPRMLMVQLPPAATPGGDGVILYPSVTTSGISESYQVGAAAAFTGEFTLGTKPVRIVD